MFQARVTVFPDVAVRDDGHGGFAPSSFADLLQRQIHLPGLDPAWTHTLIAVTVAADRNSAELTVASQPVVAMSLDRHLRLLQGVPPAHVRVHDTDGNVLVEARLSAPLQPGQEVEIGGVHHVVQSHTWPGRHPDTGTCTGDLDWQHVVVTPAPRLPVAPTAAS